MKRLKGSSLVLFCILTFFFSNIVWAQTAIDDENNPRSTRIGLIFLGSVTTSVSRKKDGPWFFIGWAVLILGTMSSVSRMAKDVLKDIVLIDNTQIDMYAGGNAPENLQGTVDAKHYLEKIEIDSYVAANEPNLSKSLPMSEVVTQFQMDPQRVGRILIEAKSMADALLNGDEFGKEIFPVSYDTLRAKFSEGDLSQRETHLVKNYLRLRNIRLNGV